MVRDGSGKGQKWKEPHMRLAALVSEALSRMLDIKTIPKDADHRKTVWVEEALPQSGGRQQASAHRSSFW